MPKFFFAWFLALLVVGLATWYFLIKDHDYTISFNAPVTVGELYQKSFYYEYGYFDQPTISRTEPFSRIYKSTNFEGNEINLLWEFSQKDTSKAVAKIHIDHPDNSFVTRLQLLFGKTEEQQKVLEEAKRFQSSVEKNTELYDVKIIGEEDIPASFCLCIPLENTVNKKAFDMIKHIRILSAFVADNELKMDGKPRIEVQQWNFNNNYIKYNFCFPIQGKTNVPVSSPLFYKAIPSKKALKAIYNGNYMYSHLAWVNLLNYAKIKNISVQREPLEIFNDNPEMGGDARIWEAEIYLPLQPL